MKPRDGGELLTVADVAAMARDGALQSVAGAADGKYIGEGLG
jgi:hypothetical protein